MKMTTQTAKQKLEKFFGKRLHKVEAYLQPSGSVLVFYTTAPKTLQKIAFISPDNHIYLYL